MNAFDDSSVPSATNRVNHELVPAAGLRFALGIALAEAESIQKGSCVFMTTRWKFVSVAAGIMALALTAGPLTAQSSKTARLTTKEVVTLIQNAKTSADHEKLAAYYEQTAADLDEKAKEHKELAAAYKRMPASGNPRIPSPARPVSHCESIATEAAKAATEARSMAEHHRMLAKEAGKPGQ